MHITQSTLLPADTMAATLVPKISLLNFEARKEEIKAEIMDAAKNSGFLSVNPYAGLLLY